jgi:hypothetical protein
MRVAVLLLAVLLAAPGSIGAAEPKPKPDEMVNNPPYAHWSAFKPGTTVTQREVVKLPNGTTLEQRIATKLISRDKNKVVIETSMTEGEAAGKSGMAESTKTLTTFPAKVKMSQVDTPAEASVAVTEGAEDVDVKGKKVSAEWVEAVTHNGDETTTEKVWTARDVPGGIIKRTVTRKKGDTVVSDSVLELVQFK